MLLRAHPPHTLLRPSRVSLAHHFPAPIGARVEGARINSRTRPYFTGHKRRAWRVVAEELAKTKVAAEAARASAVEKSFGVEVAQEAVRAACAALKAHMATSAWRS